MGSAFTYLMKNLAIFASGSGTNAENIARLFHQGNRVRVAVVLCNRRSAGVYDRMKAFGVPVIYIPSSTWDSAPQTVVDTLAPYNIDLVVLAGFMRTVRPEIINAYRDRIINIHPSLLPAYGGKGMYGHHVHEAVIAAGETKSGVSVHYVTDKIDGGEIIMQQSVEITPEDTPETLEAKIHPVEYSIYPRAIVAALSRLSPGEDVGGSATQTGTPAKEPEAATQSVDSAWAERLHLHYDAQEAAQRCLKAEERARANAARPQAAPAQLGQMPPRPAAPMPGSPAPLSARQAPYGDAPEIKQPQSHLAAAIVVTILCCTLPGIVAIIYSSSVSSRLAASDYAGALKASRRAEGWIIASFVLGLLSATLWFPLTIISSLL